MRRVSFIGLVLVVLLVLVGLAPGRGLAQQLSSEWQKIGTVGKWVTTDTKFYRTHAEAQMVAGSTQLKNQSQKYLETRKYRGELDGLGVEAWQGLSIEEQNKRRDLAAAELKFLVDFRNRLLNQVRNTQLELKSGWGGRIGDETVVGIGLGRLRTAVGLDPSNPYAWHLYSYFASLMGDNERALQAIAGAEAALALLSEFEETELRGAVALDKAWLLRAQGEFAAALVSLNEAATHSVVGLEARLVRGLLAAQMGDDQTALTIARELRDTSVATFPMDFLSSDFGPGLRNVDNWPRRSSTYLHDWIIAYTWLRVGEWEMARIAFGDHKLNYQRPFAHRFWNEAGTIYEKLGGRSRAKAAWEQAWATTPYRPFLVYTVGSENLGKLTGRSGHLPYRLSFNSNFVNGSRLAYGAALVRELAVSHGEEKRRRLATLALDQLEICQKFGVFSGQALVLQGQVYYLMDDIESAQMSMEQALTHLQEMGDDQSYSAVMADLAAIESELVPRDIANFYSQSGQSQGRWPIADDPMAAVAGLRSAYENQPNDESRRNLARFLIRNGELAEGRKLAGVSLMGSAVTEANLGGVKAADLQLLLEAERTAGEKALAVQLVAVLEAGGQEPWQQVGVWALVGFICLDHGLEAEAKLALQHASALDPGNQGLKIQLSRM